MNSFPLYGSRTRRMCVMAATLTHSRPSMRFRPPPRSLTRAPSSQSFSGRGAYVDCMGRSHASPTPGSGTVSQAIRCMSEQTVSCSVSGSTSRDAHTLLDIPTRWPVEKNLRSRRPAGLSSSTSTVPATAYPLSVHQTSTTRWLVRSGSTVWNVSLHGSGWFSSPNPVPDNTHRAKYASTSRCSTVKGYTRSLRVSASARCRIPCTSRRPPLSLIERSYIRTRSCLNSSSVGGPQQHGKHVIPPDQWGTRPSPRGVW